MVVFRDGKKSEADLLFGTVRHHYFASGARQQKPVEASTATSAWLLSHEGYIYTHLAGEHSTTIRKSSPKPGRFFGGRPSYKMTICSLQGIVHRNRCNDLRLTPQHPEKGTLPLLSQAAGARLLVMVHGAFLDWFLPCCVRISREFCPSPCVRCVLNSVHSNQENVY